jgi:predicted protein tyrosine phosphatase
MPKILVTPLSAVPQCIAEHAPSHLVTLLGADYMIDTPDGVALERHLKLAMDDIVDASPGAMPPSEHHVESLLAFSRRWDAKSPMLVHCWAGISRSMAATFTVLCDRLGPNSELAIAKMIRFRAPHADPNKLFVRIADDLLGRSGRMVDAVEWMGRGKLAIEGRTVEFPLILEMK